MFLEVYKLSTLISTGKIYVQSQKQSSHSACDDMNSNFFIWTWNQQLACYCMFSVRFFFIIKKNLKIDKCFNFSFDCLAREEIREPGHLSRPILRSWDMISMYNTTIKPQNSTVKADNWKFNRKVPQVKNHQYVETYRLSEINPISIFYTVRVIHNGTRSRSKQLRQRECW